MSDDSCFDPVITRGQGGCYRQVPHKRSNNTVNPRLFTRSSQLIYGLFTPIGYNGLMFGLTISIKGKNKIMKKTSILILVMGLLLTACSAPIAADTVPEAVVETEAMQSPVVEEENLPLAETAAEIDLVVVDEEGNTAIDADALDSALTTLPTGELTAQEVDGLAFMREEEKLARDVYLTLYDQWNMPVFQNIAGSESTHMDAVLTILDRYGLEDPSAEKAVGEFTNPDLQALYDQLVELGSQSLARCSQSGRGH